MLYPVCVLSDSPVETTPTTTAGGKNPDRTVSTGRRVISDMRRINVGFNTSQYYPVLVPSIESIARLLIAMTVGFPCFQIEMAKRDIASAFRLLRLHPAPSLLMCTEFPGWVLGREYDLVLFYLAMPFGWNGSPANFAIFGDAVPHIHSQFGMGRPDWFASLDVLSKLYVVDGLLFDLEISMRFGWNGPPANFALFGDAIPHIHSQFGMGRPGWFASLDVLSKLYVGDGLLFDLKISMRQQANTLVWESTTLGLLGPKALNMDKLQEEGRWRNAHTMLGFDIDSESQRITLPEAKVAGGRVLFDQLGEKAGPRALEVVTHQQIR